MEINDIIQSKRRMVQERIEKSFGVDIEKARMAGDTRVKNGKTFVWTEYAPGKFDWRISNKKTTINPASRKSDKGDKNDKKKNGDIIIGDIILKKKYDEDSNETWYEGKDLNGDRIRILQETVGDNSSWNIEIKGKMMKNSDNRFMSFEKISDVISEIKDYKKKQSTASAKVPRGMKLQDEDSWVEIYDKNGKKIKEEFFADLGFDPDEEWNEKDGNYDIKGGGKMVVPKEHNTRIVEDANESIKKLEEDEEDDEAAGFEPWFH